MPSKLSPRHLDYIKQLASGWLFLAAALLIYFAYSLGLPGDFLLDDRIRIHALDLDTVVPHELIGETLRNLHGATGRPVGMFSLALTKATSGPDPATFKTQNILLHLLTGILQFWTLAYLLPYLKSTTIERQYRFEPNWRTSACITAIWLAHPILVSTVLYPVQRLAILAALFSWAGILCYLSGRHLLVRRRFVTATVLLFIAAPIFFVLGVGSKENAVLMPLYFWLINLFSFRQPDPSSLSRRIAVSANTLLIYAPVFVGLAYFGIHANEFLSGFDYRPFSLLERLLTEAYIIWWYAGLIFLPLLSRMTLFHDNHWIATTDNVPAYLAITALALLFTLALKIRNRQPLLAFGLLFFLTSHLLESTILPLELVFEHRNYMGGIGLLLSAYALIYTLATHFKVLQPSHSYWVAGASFAIMLCLLSIRAWTWSDATRLASISLQEHPDSVRAHVAAANILLRNDQLVRAASILESAARISPTDAGPVLHLTAISCHATASPTLEDIARARVRDGTTTPYSVDASHLLANSVWNGKCNNIDRSDVLEMLHLMIVNDSTHPYHRYFLRVIISDLLASMARYEEALLHASRALRQSASAPLTQRHRAIEQTARLAALTRNKEEYERALLEYDLLQKENSLFIHYAFPELEKRLLSLWNNPAAPSQPTIQIPGDQLMTATALPTELDSRLR